jgi:NAD(P)-dependent dehydrogenase (short-subunit alcohol dehydrogenase family)
MEVLAGRIAVVTGAASGIGLAIVEALIEREMRVAMADVDGPGLAREAGRLRGEGGEVLDVVTDVADPASVDALAGRTVERFGRLDLAVNNAGIVATGRSWELPLEQWRRIVDVDLWGVVHGIRAFVPRILETGEPGHLVNVASMAAVRPLAGLGPYVASKHAVLGLSDVLRAELDELGAPVGVSTVMPGRVRSAMNPVAELPASAVAAEVLEAVRRDRPYVFTDHQSEDEVAARFAAITDARDDVLP